MHFTASAAALAFVALAHAQGYGNSPSSSSAATTTSGTSAAAPAATSGIHMIVVGQGGFSFSPSSITAQIGDQVQFNFASSGHSVAEAAFGAPCVPSNSSAFYSGFVDSGKQWTLTVNSTEPLWYYCSQVSHCQAGMVGVINPPSGQTIDDFTSAAKNTSSSQSPATVQGGLLQAATQPSASSSGTAASSPSASPSSGAAALAIIGTIGIAVVGGAMGQQLL